MIVLLICILVKWLLQNCNLISIYPINIISSIINNISKTNNVSKNQK